ncbi:hypothetical protein K1719_035894 [Acacia pycnantha]|nr:hypothetical protein K1719_037613 [Acacia pycnantha]KAI9082154.1 hypothetical protein K1719_035894 [Acacia pycnantha]
MQREDREIWRVKVNDGDEVGGRKKLRVSQKKGLNKTQCLTHTRKDGGGGVVMKMKSGEYESEKETMKGTLEEGR